MSSLLRLCLLAVVLAAPLAPAAAQNGSVPAPREVLGFGVGEAGHLAEWSQITSYFGRLGDASPMVQVERIGTTAQNRPMIMAVITSAANQQRLAEIQANQAKLADPRGVPQAELDRIIATQPAVTFIGASLHGNEIMATQMSMELAHDLVTKPELVEALEDVVVLLVPGMNPDGLDITRDWWMRTRQTASSGAQMPMLYHFYVGHDNNRDFYMVTQPETQAVTSVLYKQWFPEVVWDVHQQGNRGARYFIPPFDDPINPNIDPLIVRMTNVVGTQMALDLTEAGKTGITHQQTYDLWWHGGGRTVPARHNMVGILSEAASADYGDAIQQNVDSLRQPGPGSMFPEAWAGGDWTPRDIVEYELISGYALVKLLHRQREDFVRNFASLAQKQVRAGETGGPFAYIVPADQADPGSAAIMLQTLQKGGVEVHRAQQPLQVAGRSYAAGSWVVLMGQPFRAHAKDLLERQAYPDMRQYPGGPPDVPYDVAGWTLPLQMGVDAVAVEAPFNTSGLAKVDSVMIPAGRIQGSGNAIALDPRQNATHRAIHAALKEGGKVTFSSAPVRAGRESWPAGTPVISGVSGLAQKSQQWARDLGVSGQALRGAPVGETLEQLRVGLYKPWTGSMDEGWTRWVFEQWEVPFDTILSPRMRAGGLASDFDVIVIPDLGYDEIVEGSRRAHPDFAGGIGAEGIAALKQFVEGGGTLVLLDSSSELGIRDLGVPVRDVTEGHDGPDAWYSPGSLLRVRWDTAQPLASGMPEESAVYYARGPVFEVAPGADNVHVVARYPERDLLMSGYAQAEEQVAGKAALVEAEIGEGKVILFGFRPQHRGQPHDTFKVLFNALYGR
jgi:hypothetical protein